VLVLEGAGLDEPIEEDGFPHESLSFEVAEDGAGVYTLTVSPYCTDACESGSYGLRILIFDPLL
jgi:hypothetical protein